MKNTEVMVFSLEGDCNISKGDKIDIRIEGSVESIDDRNDDKKKIKLRIIRISQIENEIRTSRADAELNGMLPSNTSKWALVQLLDAISKTPAQHDLDRIMEK